MKIHPTVLVVAAAAVMTGLTGCGAIDGTAAPAASSVPAGMGSPDQATDGDAAQGDAAQGDAAEGGSAPAGTAKKKAPKHNSTPTHESTPSHAPQPQGPRVVSFKVVQKPKCPEGTAVFRSENVPLIIKWKITGADSAALSVDDPTGTPGTYGPVELQGTQEFTFSCGGPVGSTETHRYDIYTVGGGAQKHKTLKVSAKVLDQGKDVGSANG
ncbi:hypothetical protein GCM10020358_41540 [Amorphoplanes nipponensis]|uniref:Lipoprotein antigen n=1 Tax=Actinoplanes nipponensis TaxID=135950 RepID=A0A919JAZ6_9ACTN|nr:hypothetical protein [Actinoplanes nipponensis]GIE47654.1 hypothetical protein Ani05nite_11880 [Actinoplanes nipponensis]